MQSTTATATATPLTTTYGPCEYVPLPDFLSRSKFQRVKGKPIVLKPHMGDSTYNPLVMHATTPGGGAGAINTYSKREHTASTSAAVAAGCAGAPPTNNTTSAINKAATTTTTVKTTLKTFPPTMSQDLQPIIGLQGGGCHQLFNASAQTSHCMSTSQRSVSVTAGTTTPADGYHGPSHCATTPLGVSVTGVSSVLPITVCPSPSSPAATATSAVSTQLACGRLNPNLIQQCGGLPVLPIIAAPASEYEMPVFVAPPAPEMCV